MLWPIYEDVYYEQTDKKQGAGESHVATYKIKASKCTAATKLG